LSVASAVHCINPDCPHPYPQRWDNKFCNSCGSLLRLNDRYLPLQLLGTGGFAILYSIWDLQTQTERVLKVLVETSPKALQLFEQEAAVLSNLKHPGIPSSDPDGYFQITLGNPPRIIPCLVMEKINGHTLQDILDKNPQGCSETVVRNWLSQAVEILQELHQRQIIHRDIKPSNLMLRLPQDASTAIPGQIPGGQLVLIDFGGAKQMGSAQSRAQASSTRLFSSGYSPPEQVVGGVVGPATDFYALGRTLIHLLTGQYPSDLEDPISGELRWRHCLRVSPDLADLLDDMVRLDVQERPATAREMQGRLANFSQLKTQISQPKPVFTDTIAQVAQRSIAEVVGAIAVVGGGMTNASMFLIRATIRLVKACLDTTWEMILGAIGAAVGTVAGFVLAYWTVVGNVTASILSQQLLRLFPGAEGTIGPEILLFVAAGLGTAGGLTAAGGFEQRRRPIIAGLMGIFGYGLSGLIWQLTPNAPPESWVGLIAIAAMPMALGLGLPSHHLVHALVAALGTSGVLAGLVALNFLPPDPLVIIFSYSNWPSFGASIALFCLLGVTLAFWLGVSHYFLVPILRWLGWR
jgi:hypothetical protein